MRVWTAYILSLVCIRVCESCSAGHSTARLTEPLELYLCACLSNYADTCSAESSTGQHITPELSVSDRTNPQPSRSLSPMRRAGFLVALVACVLCEGVAIDKQRHVTPMASRLAAVHLENRRACDASPGPARAGTTLPGGQGEAELMVEQQDVRVRRCKEDGGRSGPHQGRRAAQEASIANAGKAADFPRVRKDPDNAEIKLELADALNMVMRIKTNANSLVIEGVQETPAFKNIWRTLGGEAFPLASDARKAFPNSVKALAVYADPLYFSSSKGIVKQALTGVGKKYLAIAKELTDTPSRTASSAAPSSAASTTSRRGPSAPRAKRGSTCARGRRRRPRGATSTTRR